MRELIYELQDVGAVLSGNYFIVLKSGRVSTSYVNMDPVYTCPHLVRRIGQELACSFNNEFEVVAGPAVGGIPLIYPTAEHAGENVRTVWADKTREGNFVMDRMLFPKAVHGKRILVVEDVTTTGNSAKSVADITRACGGEVIGAAFVWNRGQVNADIMGVPTITSLIKTQIPSWEPGKHESWGEWPLVMDVGHPELISDYPGNQINILS